MLDQQCWWWFSMFFFSLPGKTIFRNIYVNTWKNDSTGIQQQLQSYEAAWSCVRNWTFFNDSEDSSPVDLYLIFEKSNCKSQFVQTGFLTCKNQFQNWFLHVRNTVRWTWFLKFDFSKIKYRSLGSLDCFHEVLS